MFGNLDFCKLCTVVCSFVLYLGGIWEVFGRCLGATLVIYSQRILQNPIESYRILQNPTVLYSFVADPVGSWRFTRGLLEVYQRFTRGLLEVYQRFTTGILQDPTRFYRIRSCRIVKDPIGSSQTPDLEVYQRFTRGLLEVYWSCF